jgi:hypothetical protein
MASLRFDGDFPAEAKRMLVPSGRYIGFRCSACGELFAILDDFTRDGDISTSGDGRFNVTCPGCNAVNRRDAADLVLFEAATGGPTMPPGSAATSPVE